MNRIARTSLAIAGVASIVLVLSCEAIIGDTVPQFTCEGTSTAGCPSGQYCNGSGCIKCDTKDVCDHLDNDCNGKVDDGVLCDADEDNFTWCGNLDPNGHPIDVDCDDNDPTVHPFATEICDGKDNDCNGLIDDGAICPDNGTCIDGKCVQNPCDPDAGTCPSNEHCDAVTHTCVSNTLLDIGQACSADSECKSPYFCADSSVVGTEVLPSLGKGMCTEPCCSSTSCPTGFVCYTAGTGGRYCVDPTTLGRGMLGSEQGGATETSGSRCRSGLSANGKCADACCSDADCASGTACAIGNMDNHDGMYCQVETGNTGAPGSSCYSSDKCENQVCVEYDPFDALCTAQCCGSSKCGTLFGDPARCNYEETYTSQQVPTGDYIPVCSQNTVGSSGLGSTCASNTDCASDVCYDDLTKAEKYCTDVCCVDTDCGSTGWVCRPSPTLPRCIKN